MKSHRCLYKNKECGKLTRVKTKYNGKWNWAWHFVHVRCCIYWLNH